MKFAAVLEKRGIKYEHQPRRFVLSPNYKNGEPFKNYMPDFFVPSERRYYEVISTRQCLQNGGWKKLKKIEAVEKMFGITVVIVKPDGTPIERTHEARMMVKRRRREAEILERLGKKWDSSLTQKELSRKLGVASHTVRLYSKKFKLRYRKRNEKQVYFRGKRQNLTAWARELGVDECTISNRQKLCGWSLEKALSTPRQESGKYVRTEEWKRKYHPKLTHCKKGHPLSGDNLYVSAKGYRGCRTCARRRCKKYYILKRMAASCPVT